jgi:hypothetical protein
LGCVSWFAKMHRTHLAAESNAASPRAEFLPRPVGKRGGTRDALRADRSTLIIEPPSS